MRKPTVNELYNAGVLMNLTKDTDPNAGHDFMDLFKRSSFFVRYCAIVRLLKWRAKQGR